MGLTHCRAEAALDQETTVFKHVLEVEEGAEC